MGNYNYYKMFGCFNRKFKISEMGPPPDVIDVFQSYSMGESEMLPDTFLRFLIEFQGEESTTMEDAQDIMDRILNHSRSHLTRYAFNIHDFFHYLLLDDLNGPIQTKVHHDMSAPLQHYFIYTGHNSYLTGNQLSSDSSEVPIIKALQRGVRAIELDLWPNNAKDGIQVLHGRTLTTPVTLHKCLKSIKEHAFVNSSYPVVITLEDHLTPNLQAKVAEMVTNTFGEMLYCPKPSDKDEFPSPDSLRHQIILSTKPPKEYLRSKNPRKERSSLDKDSSEEESNSDQDDDDESCSASKRNNENEIASSSRSRRLSEILGVDYEDDDIEYEKSGQQAAPQYKHLIAIHASKPKKGTRRALMDEPGKAKRLSLSEQALERAASLYGTDIVRFTQKYILRVFPKGTRVTSTNFRPLTAWMHGAQMVAFNMQGYGRSLWMMHGMFRSNGGCGYVKKPEFLMTKGPNGEVFDPKAILPVKTTLKVKVYMGDGWRLDFSQTHFDAFSPPDFYAKVYIVGVPVDVAKKRTRVIGDDWTPIWNEEFTFPLRVPELALLEIVVQEYDVDKDDFAGQTCLPVSELRPGIRVVPLHNKKGEKFKSVKLLMRFLFV
ncbi:phosphoinositide phospholipase C 6-like isoform X2 [Cynara cardunculus var. scolymus]|uniref:phosphoinositide phospholipase C 6-like isoform X2 n=1 Tax=Cynara cardunculus var. scolymus TaxID=59895 RepID=UPI000D62F2FB|nr:phosphoinositide phospholipase C 6-like isoform X2 [Cynara cardunculus var. scolymus]